MANPEKQLGLWAVLVSVAGVLTVAPNALAQSSNINNPSMPPQTSSDAGFPSTDRSNGLFGDGNSPFDLIHRAVLMNETSMSDFSRQHQNRMNSEAANFRLQQQEAIRQRNTLEAEVKPVAEPEANQ